MHIGSVGAQASYLTQSVQRAPEAAEVQKGGQDHDGDSDDGGTQAVTGTVAAGGTGDQTTGLHVVA